MAEKEITLKIKAKDETGTVFEKAFGKLEGGAKKARAEARASGETALESVLNDGLIRGGLKAAGLAIPGLIAEQIGDGLKDATAKAIELREQFRQGKIDAVGMGLGIAESIPILGSFIEAGQNIRELLTGEKHDIDEINEATRIQNEIQDIRLESARRSRDVYRETLEIIRKTNEEIAQTGLVGEAAARATNRSREDDAVASFKEALEKAKNTDPADNDSVKKARADLAEFQSGEAKTMQGYANSLKQIDAARMAFRNNADAKTRQQIDDFHKAFPNGQLIGEPSPDPETAEKYKKLTEKQQGYTDAVQAAVDALKSDTVGKAQAELDAHASQAHKQRLADDRQTDLIFGRDREKDARDNARNLRSVAADDAAAQAESNAKLLQEGAQHSKDAAQAQKDAVKESLNAQIISIKEAAQKRKDAIDDAALNKERNTSDPIQRGIIGLNAWIAKLGETAKANRDMGRAQKEAAASTEEIGIRAQQERDRLQEDLNQSKSQAKGEARELQLRREGRGFQADQEKINRERDEKIEKIRADAKLRAQNDKANADLINQKAEKDAQKLTQDAAEAQRQLGFAQLGQRNFGNPEAVSSRFASGAAARTREENDPARAFYALSVQKQDEMIAFLGDMTRALTGRPAPRPVLTRGR